MKQILSFFKKPIQSASDEITTKFKTPFFSTFIIVWIIANNKFIYDLFFNSNIKDKTQVLATQFNINEASFYGRNFKLIGFSLLIILLYYLIINLSRVITMISEERIKVNLLALLKSKTISTREDVDFWKKRGDKLNQKNFQLQEELNILRSSNEMTKNDLRQSKETIQKFEDGRKILRQDIETLMNREVYKLESTGLVKIDELKTSIKTHFDKFEKLDKTPTFLSV